jgi:hypothetical protein
MEVTTSLKDKVCVLLSVFAMSLMGVFAMKGSPCGYVPPLSPIVQSPIVPPPKPQPPLPPAQPTDPELIGLQVPVPKSIRIYNNSGSQCVWCTAQMLGTFHNVKGVFGLTDQYKHATGPSEFNRVMTARHVKFKQVAGRDLDFLDEWVTNKKMGCGIGINNTHVIMVVNFERGKKIKVIDNSDRTLRVQTWSWDKFMRNFTGWVFVILPDDTPASIGWDNNVDDGKLYSR